MLCKEHLHFELTMANIIRISLRCSDIQIHSPDRLECLFGKSHRFVGSSHRCIATIGNLLIYSNDYRQRQWYSKKPNLLLVDKHNGCSLYNCLCNICPEFLDLLRIHDRSKSLPTIREDRRMPPFLFTYNSIWRFCYESI